MTYLLLEDSEEVDLSLNLTQTLIRNREEEKRGNRKLCNKIEIFSDAKSVWRVKMFQMCCVLMVFNVPLA